MRWMGDHVGWMYFGWALGLALLLLVVWLSARGGTPPAGGADESPETILKRRYARGEIDREEFDRRLAGLRR